MKVAFDERALADLEGIYHWIAKDHTAAAKAVVERVFASTEHLASFPYMGHRGLATPPIALDGRAQPAGADPPGGVRA